MTLDAHKLKTVVHYICVRCCADSRTLDVASLNTILWLADGKTYARLGHAILGEEYTRERHGPKSVHLDSVLVQLEAEGHVIHKVGESNEYVATGPPDVSVIREAELRILDEVIEEVAQSHRLQVTDSASAELYVSPPEQAWEIAEQGERVPYQQQLLIRFPALTKDDQQWVDSELKELRRVQ